MQRKLKYINKLCNFLDLKKSIFTKKIMKKENLPRLIDKFERVDKLNKIKSKVRQNKFEKLLKLENFITRINFTMVIWILGLSGAGKSFLSEKLKQELKNDYGEFIILDGDVIRNVFDNDLGFSIKDRNINASRISKLAHYLSQNKINVIVPVLSLFPDWLAWNRKI